MAYGTRAERPKLGPQAESDADRFLNSPQLILIERLNYYISSPQPRPLSIAPCWRPGTRRSALWHQDEA